ncbi:MAG: hypothetical protein P8N68_12020 [Paracoccaceae bacterium]|nr:hypothetical protein [Paracoccaceae bacterium]
MEQYEMLIRKMISEEQLFEATELVATVVLEGEPEVAREVTQWIVEELENVEDDLSGDGDYIWVALSVVASTSRIHREGLERLRERMTAMQQDRPKGNPKVEPKGTRVDDLKATQRIAARDRT